MILEFLFLTVVNDTDQPMRARDLCRALAPTLGSRHVEGIRSRLKRLVEGGTLAEIEPGLFHPPHPEGGHGPSDQGDCPTPTPKRA